jgi:hypothetical protein
MTVQQAIEEAKKAHPAPHNIHDFAAALKEGNIGFNVKGV